MPLPKHTVQPVRVSHVPVPAEVDDELQYVVNATLCNLMRQMASISQLASNMFEELTAALSNSAERTLRLQHRLAALQEDVQAMRCGDEEGSSSANTPPVQLPPFASKKPADSQVLNHNTIPLSMQASYERAEPTPPLQQMDRLRDDGKISMKLYSDPSFFFDLWSHEMLQEHKHRRVAKKKKQRVKGKPTKAGGLLSKSDSNHLPGPQKQAHQMVIEQTGVGGHYTPSSSPPPPPPPPCPLPPTAVHSYSSSGGRAGIVNLPPQHPPPPQPPPQAVQSSAAAGRLSNGEVDPVPVMTANPGPDGQQANDSDQQPLPPPPAPYDHHHHPGQAVSQHACPTPPPGPLLPPPPPLPFLNSAEFLANHQHEVLPLKDLPLPATGDLLNSSDPHHNGDRGYNFEDELAHNLCSLQSWPPPLQHTNTTAHQTTKANSPTNGSGLSHELPPPPCPIFETPAVFADPPASLSLAAHGQQTLPPPAQFLVPPVPPQLTTTASPLPPPPPPSCLPPPPPFPQTRPANSSLDNQSSSTLEAVTEKMNGLTTTDPPTSITKATKAPNPVNSVGPPADLLSAIRAGLALRKVADRKVPPAPVVKADGPFRKNSLASLVNKPDVQAIYDAVRRRREFMDSSEDDEDDDTAAGANSDSSGW